MIFRVFDCDKAGALPSANVAVANKAALRNLLILIGAPSSVFNGVRQRDLFCGAPQARWAGARKKLLKPNASSCRRLAQCGVADQGLEFIAAVVATPQMADVAGRRIF